MTEDRQADTITLGEAASRYLATVPEADRVAHQRAVNAFIRWHTRADAPVGTLSAETCSRYAEQESPRDADFAAKVEPFKAFLAYVRKQGWVKENLATGIKVKRSRVKTSGPAQRVKREAVPMTRAKYDEITKELSDLRDKRLLVIKDIQVAAADKDFRENAPFHAAREQKGHIEGKIMELDETLASAVINEGNRESSHSVCIGDTILLLAVASQQEMRFTIVNPKEVAPSKGHISTASPVGKAAVGKCEGDFIEVVVPSGRLQYCIKRIER